MINTRALLIIWLTTVWVGTEHWLQHPVSTAQTNNLMLVLCFGFLFIQYAEMEVILLILNLVVWFFSTSPLDQRWPLASDPLHLSDPGPELTPHSGCIQPADDRTWRTLPPRGRTRVLLIGFPWRTSNTSWRSDHMEDDQWGGGGVNTFVDTRTTPPTQPPIFSTKYAWTAGSWGHQRKQAPWKCRDFSYQSAYGK